MQIKIFVEGIKNAERFSNICQDYPYEMFLRSGDFCMDPKSMLGVLAIFYSARGSVVIDIGDEMPEKDRLRFVKAIGEYIRED